MKRSLVSSVILSVILLAAPVVQAGWLFDLETGAVFSGLNDARIPGEDGTKFSLVDDLQTDPAPFFRLRLGGTLARRHNLVLLYAPLSLIAEGKIDRDVEFNGVTFPAGTPLRAFYRFDSYRLTYRYDFYLDDHLELGAGLTGKIRDAAIGLDGAEFTENTNTGLVPLINLRLFWRFVENWGLLVEGDGLVGPQGRAEDFQAAVEARLTEQLAVRLGYRILEGGADNEKVYTFSLFHYALVGFHAGF